MAMGLEPQDQADHGSLMRNIGFVLMVYGGIGLVWGLAQAFVGGDFSPTSEMMAIVGGIFLWKQSLQSAYVVRILTAAFLAIEVTTILGYNIMYPPDLIRTYLRSVSVGNLIFYNGFQVVSIIVALGVYRALGASRIQKAIQVAGKGSRRIWLRPWAGFIYGFAFPFFLMATVYTGTHGARAKQIVERARAEYGPEYQYFVKSISTNWSSNKGTTIRSVVLKYNDTSIKSVRIEWAE